MGREAEKKQIAFMGDPGDLAAIIAAQVIQHLEGYVKLDQALTVDEAAKVLQVSPQQVRELAAVGKLPGFDVATPGATARQWRFWPGEISKLKS